MPRTGPGSSGELTNIAFIHLISKPSLLFRFHFGWNMGEEVTAFLYQYSSTNLANNIPKSELKHRRLHFHIFTESTACETASYPVNSWDAKLVSVHWMR